MNKSKRLLAIDYFRGFILVVMFIIHFVNKYFNIQNTDSFLLSSLDFVVFGFLLLIGLTVYYHYEDKFRKKTSLGILSYFFKRGIKIFLIYLVYSLVYVFVFGKPTIENLFRIVILNKLNYDLLILIPISFYIIIIPLILLFIRKYNPRPYVFSISGVILYLISYKLNFLGFDSSLRFVKSIIFGHMDWLTFPLFQWILPFFIGVHLGVHLKNVKISNSEKGKQLLVFGLSFLIIFLLLFFSRLSMNQAVNITTEKYPPTPYHMVYSIALCFIFLGLFFLLEKINLRLFILKIFGQNSLMGYISQWVYLRMILEIGVLNRMPFIQSVITLILIYFTTLFNSKHRII